MMWRIRSQALKDRRGRPQYWSEDVGWTWKEFADVYSEEEHAQRLMPPGGAWEATE